jgi:DNA repair exonuclease SbcCD nuclease subunit
MTFRFVHTADVHLDSPLKSLALKDPEIADLVANATRQTFVNTVDLCIEENVDAFLIAGDLYDGDLRSIKTAAFLTGELRRLTAASVRVFIVKGNHDAESRITKHVAWPESVDLFTGRGETIVIEEKNVVLHGISFAQPRVPDSLLAKYKPPVEGAINIGLLHTSLAGSAEHDVYSPCSVQELKDQRYDYWALGHIHKRAVHAEGPTAIVMPGIPQGRHINEAGPKSVTLVEIGDDKTIKIEERITSVAQFERVSIDVTAITEWADLVYEMERVFTEVGEKVLAKHLITRLELQGASSLASRMRRDFDVLDEEARSVAQRCGSVFIEQINVTAGAIPVETKSAIADPVGELRQLIAEGGVSDQADIEAQTLALCRDVQKNLPPELRDILGADDDAMVTLVKQCLEQGAEDVLAHLDGAEEPA